jgi:hypothetical protein
MFKNICNYKNTNKLIITYKPFLTPTMNEKREIGLQLANYQERKQSYKENQKKKESIKNMVWLG